MIEGKRHSLVKPSLQTPYHIDFDWWQQNDRDWRVYLRSYLSPEDQLIFSEISEEAKVDIVDPETGEVSQVDALQHVLIARYSNRGDFISRNTSLTEAIFRLFLINGNIPLSVGEIAEKIGRSPNTVLQMLSGSRVYKGLRPCRLN
ncbi:MAG TPA: hypothetical protein VI451_20425 [Anaerolineales bacterium]|nr:hypothetical protein [Anaerolineales bacterium]